MKAPSAYAVIALYGKGEDHPQGTVSPMPKATVSRSRAHDGRIAFDDALSILFRHISIPTYMHSPIVCSLFAAPSRVVTSWQLHPGLHGPGQDLLGPQELQPVPEII